MYIVTLKKLGRNCAENESKVTFSFIDYCTPAFKKKRRGSVQLRGAVMEAVLNSLCLPAEMIFHGPAHVSSSLSMEMEPSYVPAIVSTGGWVPEGGLSQGRSYFV